MSNLSAIKTVQDIISSKETTIYEIVGNRTRPFPLEESRVYIIPGYQRKIRWSSENVQILIDDLQNGKKFLGTITLSTSWEGKFEIIDGQQRITVITMLVTYLKIVVPNKKNIVSLCKIDNQSFENFNELLDYEFDYSRVENENKPLSDALLKGDVLDQKKDFKEIWESIVERVDLLSEPNQEKLYSALLESDINIIINNSQQTDSGRKFCVDYFIDVNNKGVNLDRLDIIRAYAFKEDFDEMTGKWVDIQNKCIQLQKEVKYTREVLYFQYFVCNVNKEIEYKLTKLGEDYKTRENINLNDKRYDSGTFVWNLFTNEKFYSKMLRDLNDYLDFLLLVVNQETGGSDEFKKLFYTEKEELSDETRILNTHAVINSIIRNDDLVPKMMVMKYYLEVLKPKFINRNKYKIIHNINAIACVFTMRKRGKGSEQIAGRLLQEKWIDAIRKYSYKYVSDTISTIGFDKVAQINKSYTVESGQYMARRYFSLYDAYSWDSGNISVNEEVFKNTNITTGDKNIEHFIVNRKYEYALYLNDGKTLDIEIKIPTKYRKYIATIANYLILNSNFNTEIANRPVYEKIEMLDKKIEEFGIDIVIPNTRSQLHYLVIRKIMHNESAYPVKQINEAKNKTEKKKVLKEYYKKYFEDEYQKLVNTLSREELIIAIKLEYDLLKSGFVKDEDSFCYESDTNFSNVEADIDVKNKRLIMYAELYNPFYGEENGSDDYLELIDSVTEEFKRYYKDKPSIRSSDEYGGSNDVSYTIIYDFEPKVEHANIFLSNLQEISEKIQYVFERGYGHKEGANIKLDLY